MIFGRQDEKEILGSNERRGGLRVVDGHLVTELLDEIHTLDILQIREAFGYHAEWVVL